MRSGTSALVVAAAFAAPPTPSPQSLYEAASPTPSKTSSARVSSDRGSRTTLLIAGGAVLAFAGGLGIGSLRRRSGKAAPADLAGPEPVAPEPKPVAPEPKPVSAQPEPVAAEPEPAAEPVPTAKPEPVAAEPEPAAPPQPPEPAPVAPPPPRIAPATSRPAVAAAAPPRAPEHPGASRTRPIPAPAPDQPLFAARVPWPDGAESGYRCEITWQSGYRRSEFRALVRAPGAKKGTVVATSPEFRNLMKDPADTPRPELADAVRELMKALLEQGWTQVSPGGRWFNRRFVWSRPDPPPGIG